MLLAAGADISMGQGKPQSNALQHASYWGHEKVVEILLKAGANANLLMEVGKQHEKGNEDKIKDEDNHKSDDVLQNDDERAQYGSALQAASSRGYIKVMQMLLNAEAEVNAQTKSWGTALQVAASNPHTAKAVNFLLNAGADMNMDGSEDKHGTPLYLASVQDYAQVVQILLNAGADVYAKGQQGTKTALQIALKNGHKKVVQILRGAEAKATTASELSQCKRAIAALPKQSEDSTGKTSNGHA